MFHFLHEKPLLLKSPLALSDIPGDFGSADDPAIGIFEGRYCQRDIDQTSVLAATHGIVIVNALTAAHARDDFWLFINAVCRNQDRDLTCR